MSDNQTAVAVFKQTIEQASKNLSIPAESLVARDGVIAELEKIIQVTSADEQNLAVEILTKGKKILKDVEAVRVELKKPVTALGKAIETLASNFSDPLQLKLNEKLKLVSVFQTAEAERVRLEEIERQRKIQEAIRLEEEHKRKLAEAQRLAAEQVERDRLAAVALESSRLAAELVAKATGQPVPVAPVEDSDGQSDISALVAEMAVTAAAETVQQSSAAVVAIINAVEPEKAKSKGLATKMVWRYRIDNQAAALADHPELFKVEPRPSAINSAKSVDRDFTCEGITFWEEAAPTIRT